MEMIKKEENEQSNTMVQGFLQSDENECKKLAL